MSKFSIPSCFQIEQEGLSPRIEMFEEKIIKIGKLSSVNLRLEDSEVNRIHAVVEILSETEAQIMDMGSSKGTFLNGEKTQKAQFHSGAKITLGNTSLTVFIGEEAQKMQAGILPVSVASETEDPFESTVMIAQESSQPNESISQPEIHSTSQEMNSDGATNLIETPFQAESFVASAEEAEEADLPSEDSQIIMASEIVNPAQNNRPSLEPTPNNEHTSEQVAQQQAVQQQAMYAQQQAVQQQAMYAQQQAVQQQAMYAQQQAVQQQAMYAQQQAEGMVYSASQPQMFSGQASYPSNPAWQAPSSRSSMASYPNTPPISQSYQGQMGGYVAPQAQTMNTKPINDASLEETQEALEVKMIWKDEVLDHSHFYEPQNITIGESSKNTYCLSKMHLSNEMDDFPLIQIEGKHLSIQFTEEMKGYIKKGGEVRYLQQIKNDSNVKKTAFGYSFVLPPQLFVRIEIGGIVFEIQYVSAPKLDPVVFGLNLDQHLTRSMFVSFLIHGVLLFFVLMFSEAIEKLDDDYLLLNNRFAKLIVRPEKVLEEKQRKRGGTSRAKSSKGKSGKKKNAPVKNRKTGQKKKNPDGKALIDVKKLEQDITQDLKEVGMNKLLQGGGMASSIIGAKGIGGDEINGIGSFTGTKVGDASGKGGWGKNGLGIGGGGNSNNSADINDVGTHGRGGNKPGKRGRGRLKVRNTGIIFKPKPPVVIGGLDKKIIARVIARHKSRIRFCYEKELSKNEKLRGTIKIFFVIQETGRVGEKKIEKTTMNNDNVEQCILNRVGIFKFPPPTGGGIVYVRYPFIFDFSKN